MQIDFLGEGASDDLLARKLILSAGGIPGTYCTRRRSGTGKENVDGRVAGLNKGARDGNPVFELRDKDGDAGCAGDLVKNLLPQRHGRLLLRICVCAAEAWLMADVEAFARSSGVAVSRLPHEPETVARPKQMLIDLAEQGRAARLRRHLDEARRRGVPDWRSLGAWHSEFIENGWNPQRAVRSGRAPSLDRAVRRLRELVRTA